MNSPLVSVILSSYNGSQYIREAIESVLSQSYKNLECIIINDASNDNVEDIILNYKKSDDRIIYIKNKKNLGLTVSLNIGIKKSQGKYIARIDDDDIWLQNKLQKQVIFMEENLDHGLCGTGIIIINTRGEVQEKILNRTHDKDIRNYISGSNQFCHSSVIIRKDALERVGYYKDLKYTQFTEDYDLWLRIGIQYKFHNIPEYLTKYRLRKESISGKKSFTQLSNALKVYLKYRRYYPHPFIGIIKHIITIIFPKKIVSSLIKIWGKIKNLF